MKNRSENTAAAVLDRRLVTLLHARKACLKHDDLETVHDLRVATRRMRAALQLFEPFSPEHIKKIYQPVRELTRKIGQLRNLDEALLFFLDEIGLPGEGRECPDLLKRLRAQRMQEGTRVRRQLKGLDVAALKHDLELAAARLPMPEACNAPRGTASSLAGFLSQSGIVLFGDIHRLLSPSVMPEAVEVRHRLRIAIKRWRYFLEIVAELTRMDYDAVLEALKEYQTLLGRLNDLSVFATLVREGDLNSEELSRFDSVKTGWTARLFENFQELLERKPLRYVFLYQ